MNTPLEVFIEDALATMVVVQRNHGAGYIAFVADRRFVNEMVSDLTGNDIEVADLRFGILETDWYPVGYGATGKEAVEALQRRVETFLNGEDEGAWWECLYSLVGSRLYHRNRACDKYALVDPLKARNFPPWLKKYDTITSELVIRFTAKLDEEK